jgi:hypothetical protein
MRAGTREAAEKVPFTKSGMTDSIIIKTGQN